MTGWHLSLEVPLTSETTPPHSTPQPSRWWVEPQVQQRKKKTCFRMRMLQLSNHGGGQFAVSMQTGVGLPRVDVPEHRA